MLEYNIITSRTTYFKGEIFFLANTSNKILMILNAFKSIQFPKTCAMQTFFKISFTQIFILYMSIQSDKSTDQHSMRFIVTSGSESI